MADLVTLTFDFVSGNGVDRSASLYYLNDANEEQRYGEVHEHGTISQETFAGHRWIVRGNQSGAALLRVRAAAEPATQHFQIEAAAGAGDGFDDEDEQPAGGPEEDAAEGAGAWVATEGLSRFERVPRTAQTRRTQWRELDVSGNEVARLSQLEARVDTRWLWWLSAAFTALSSMSHDRQYLMWSALSIFGAYQAELALPTWLTRQTGLAAMGPHPLMTLLVLATLAGATVAALVPLTEPTLLLYNPSSRAEVRLGSRAGHSREPADAPGRPRPWVFVCDGGFAPPPAEIRARLGRQQHHYLLAAGFVAAAARVVARVAAGVA